MVEEQAVSEVVDNGCTVLRHSGDIFELILDVLKLDELVFINVVPEAGLDSADTDENVLCVIQNVLHIPKEVSQDLHEVSQSTAAVSLTHRR